MVWSRGVIVLHGYEQLVEPLVALVPVRPVAGQPRSRLPERLRLKVTQAGGCPSTARDEPGLLQHLEMPRDGRLRHPERRGELRDVRVSLGQPREDRAAG